jgi:putative transposase
MARLKKKNELFMPFVKIWVHLVWATKNRKPLLERRVRPLVFQHIFENAQSKEIYLNAIGGYDDHIHCLISLGTEQNISKVVQLIKGESAYWINKQQLIATKMEWQDEYFAVSVSESGVDKVKNYILNQEILLKKSIKNS